MVGGCSRAGDTFSVVPTSTPSTAGRTAAVDLPAPPTVVYAAPTANWQPPRLLISEMMVDPLLLEDSAGEFVELANLSGEPVRLADISLLLPSGKWVMPERPRAPVLRAGEIALLTPQGYGPNEAKVRGLKLPNQAGRLELRWRQTTVDVVQWHRKKPWPKAVPGMALERISPTADGKLGSSWRRSPTPLRVVERGSPGRSSWACDSLRNTPAHKVCAGDHALELARLAALHPKRRAVACQPSFAK